MRQFRVWMVVALVVMGLGAGHALAQGQTSMQQASCTAKPSTIAHGCNISCPVGQTAYCTDAYNEQAGACACKPAGAGKKGMAGGACAADTGSWHCSVVCPVGHSASCPPGGGPNQPSCTCSHKPSKGDAENPSSFIDQLKGKITGGPKS